MSVYTSVSLAEFEAWLSRFSLGSASAMQAITSGIENTNYFVKIKGPSGVKEYVLTLFERLQPQDLPFYLNLTDHLSKNAIRCAAPVHDRSGALFSLLNGKPACLCPKLLGAPSMQPTLAQCAEIGSELARLHLASLSFRSRLTNRRGPGWWLSASRAVRRFLSDEQNALIAAELHHQRAFRNSVAEKLPHGAVHADLFRDNVLWDGGTLSGIIDFGFAASDNFAYDLAIMVNDWCIDLSNGAIQQEAAMAQLAAYHAVRPVTSAEQAAWPTFLRAGALRFWLSRLYDLHLPRSAVVGQAHDPSHFERVLRERVHNPMPWPQVLTRA